MSNNASSHDDELPLAARTRIDSVCVLFEDAWKAGQHPRAEQYVQTVPESERPVLLLELLRVESYYRRATGEELDWEEYLARFPDYPQVVADSLHPRVACPACSSVVPDDAEACPHCGLSRPGKAASSTCATDGAVDSTPHSQDIETHRPEQRLQPDAAEHGRFLPGTLLAGRYRIVSLLGRGGMGEVYRADDLKLGQPLALKFLPDNLARDADILTLFHNEVRLARQIAHPNVCHVYDIGEAGKLHFLSMEYVDGEDLASLLRRIGRLPPDRGLIIARQLIAGLCAAHEQGIVHRDLKPKNIMLDGRGRVRITDFGLACLIERSGESMCAGTPMYMAPEQLSGEPVTVRGDLYSLGLVLYEVFTGQRPFKAESLDELARIREEIAAAPLTDVVDGLDPAVERVILHCLEREPQNRPPSAPAVLNALPGGDPLQAALAAGETPSPEMVAASRQPGHLNQAVGVLCLATIILGSVAVLLLSGKTTLVGQSKMLSPHTLTDRARQLIVDLDYVTPPADWACGFVYGTGQGPSTPVNFWYRQSPTVLVPSLFAGSFAAEGNGCVSWNDPAPAVPGDVRVRLDPQGRLLEFRAIATSSGEQIRVAPDEGRADTDFPTWCSKLFLRAGLTQSDDGSIDPRDFVPLCVVWSAPVLCDSRKAWQANCPRTGAPVRIEAAALGGKAVFFRLVSSGPETRRHTTSRVPSIVRPYIRITVFLLLVTAAGLLARHNLRRGRGDRRGAFRLAWYVLTVYAFYWVLHAGRAAKPPPWPMFIMGLEMAVFITLLMWLFYIALEPFVRRLWPETLVSWNRLLAGRVRNPLVGRDLLVGVVFGVLTKLLWQAGILAPAWWGLGPTSLVGPQRTYYGIPLQPLLGGRYCVAELFHCQAGAVAGGLTILLMLLLLRVVLRKQLLAAGAYVLYGTFVLPVGVGHPFVSWPVAAVASVLVVVLLTRFGLLAVVAYALVRLLLAFPLTANLSAWHAGGTTLLPLGTILALAGYGFYLSLAGRPLIRDAIMR